MCVIALKSMTYAIKAKNALNDISLDAQIVTLDPSLTHRGCGYGVRFNCMYLNEAENALKSRRIKYSEIINY